MIHSKTAQVFLQFLYRDYYIQRKKIKDYALNYLICYPLAFGISYGYFVSQIYFKAPTPTSSLTLVSGNVLIILLVLSFKTAIDLLFDLEDARFIEYQITKLSPRLIIIERTLFISLLCFAMAVPFFPILKLILGDTISMSTTNWPQLLTILYLGSLCTASYHMLAACALQRTDQLSSFWARCNHVLLMFGGFVIPWHTINDFSPLLGKIVLLNPLLYITEGVKQALTGDPQFFSFGACLTVLTIYPILFTLLSWYFFKRRVDHI